MRILFPDGAHEDAFSAEVRAAAWEAFAAAAEAEFERVFWYGNGGR